MAWVPSKSEKYCLEWSGVPEWWINPTLGLEKPTISIEPHKTKAYDACIRKKRKQKQNLLIYGGISVLIIGVIILSIFLLKRAKQGA